MLCFPVPVRRIAHGGSGGVCFALLCTEWMEWRGVMSVDRRKEGMEILW